MISSLSFLFNICNILALLRDWRKSPIARDLYVKSDSIGGARILMLDLRIVVGILSHPTLLLFLRLVMIFVISGIDDGWKYFSSGI